MTIEKTSHQQLAAFYAQAQEALERLAEVHGLDLPKGAATIESECLHWRLSVYAEPAQDYWARQWADHAQTLGLPEHVSPGQACIDQDGNEWTLLGLDPLGGALPVRLKPGTGKDTFMGVEQAQLLQQIAQFP